MYRLKYHRGLADRWFRFSLTKQLVMISNELNRAKNMLVRMDDMEAENAIDRAFELIDLTIESAQGSVRYELLRFREVLAAFYLEPTKNARDAENLIKVLLSFDRDSYNLVL